MVLFLLAIICGLSKVSADFRRSALEVLEDDRMHHFISARQQLPHVRLNRDLLSIERYNPSVRPLENYSKSMTVHISMSLYQLIDVNEPSQYLSMNVWMIQKWVDELLDWDPHKYDMINYTVLPFDALWIPDTVVYNSMVMGREESERYMNIVVESRHWEGKRGAKVSFLYPALYTIFCRLDVRYFPYDYQNCTLILGSWTNSMDSLDYTADETVNMQSYIPNEEWDILSFNFHRQEYLYACCQKPWAIIEGSLIIRRKPLYYVVNLVIPTTIITLVIGSDILVAVIGFFTPASTSDERTEKITMGITTLLAMSILMLMVSDQMPTTSDFVPLIAWFYLSNIIVISVGTFCTSAVLCIHGHHKYGKFPPNIVRMLFFVRICSYVCLSPPPELVRLWNEAQDNIVQHRLKRRKRSLLNTLQPVLQVTNPDHAKLKTIAEEVKPSKRRIAEDAPDDQICGKLPALSAKQNWAKVSIRLKDISSRHSDESEKVVHKEGLAAVWKQKMRRLSTFHTDSRRLSLWNAAAEFIRFTSIETPRKRESVEVTSMKQRRQCTLEWEFLAAVLDRMFLFLFVSVTMLIAVGLTVTAKLVQDRSDAIVEVRRR